MDKRTLGQGLEVSEQGLGCMGMSAWYGEIDTEESVATIHRALDLGLTFLDTADVYGNGRSEEVLGKALSSEWDKVYVASKVGNVVRKGVGGKDWSRQHIVSSRRGRSLHPPQSPGQSIRLLDQRSRFSPFGDGLLGIPTLL